jgi:eukaryotic-like serine/threonine-protein kinase
MSKAAVNLLITDLRDHDLLTFGQLADLLEGGEERFPEPRVLTHYLMGRGWLTPFQVEHVLKRRCKDLCIGHYQLIEPLGHGGMASVFKARHRRLKQIVALKLYDVRKDDEEGFQRFRREIVAAGRLDHRNVVKAIDADRFGNKFCLVLEYVPGKDLARIVEKHGRLPIRAACDYIRQASWGLQHAFERGLIHRDIKPSNLMLTWKADDHKPEEEGARARNVFTYPPPPNVQPTIKILDLGLVRLAQDELVDGSITQEGMVVGTPDFVAPEQVRDSHNVDIRADLYSLGCTFYYLLIGRPPFPGGPPVEKLVKHLTEEPTPVKELRPQVPTALAGIVHKLLAKKRRARFQTPAALSRALAPFFADDEG